MCLAYSIAGLLNTVGFLYLFLHSTIGNVLFSFKYTGKIQADIHIYIYIYSWKSEEYLIAVLKGCGYLILHKTCLCFVKSKVHYGIWNLINDIFVPSVSLKSPDISYMLNDSLTHWKILCHNALVIWKILTHWLMQMFQTLTYFTT